jgi:hypothetical protein
MAEEQNYHNWLKQELGSVIDTLELAELQKHFLRSRWLDQVIWMEGKANHARSWYYVLRLTAIIGGVMIPALVSLNIGGLAAAWIRWTVFVISLVVAISVALEEFFRYGDRWRHYRQAVETLKSEGWRFFQLAGAYRRYSTHNEAYPRFANIVEEISQQDVQAYVSQIVDDKEQAKDNPSQAQAG